MPCPIGFTLQPEAEFLEHVAVLLPRIDYFEVAPETTWTTGADGSLRTNGYFHRFLELGAQHGTPFVAHGVGMSMGSVSPAEDARREIWLARVAEDQREFEYRWYTDHLGATVLADQSFVMPLPVPMNQAAVQTVRAQLRAMQRVVPLVGVENTAQTFLLGDALDEPSFLRDTLGGEHHLLLDLHNLVITADNLGFCAEAWLDRVDLSSVIEIHVAGGDESDPQWLASRRVFRLDSHSARIPERVWTLLADVAPLCPNLRGITLERMEGTVSANDVPILAAELDRLRTLAEALP